MSRLLEFSPNSCPGVQSRRQYTTRIVPFIQVNDSPENDARTVRNFV